MTNLFGVAGLQGLCEAILKADTLVKVLMDKLFLKCNLSPWRHFEISSDLLFYGVEYVLQATIISRQR